MSLSFKFSGCVARHPHSFLSRKIINEQLKLVYFYLLPDFYSNVINAMKVRKNIFYVAKLYIYTLIRIFIFYIRLVYIERYHLIEKLIRVFDLNVYHTSSIGWLCHVIEFRL